MTGSDEGQASGQQRHPVHFIGAGPGDPELITVKGRRLLDEADLIIFTGSLVPKEILAGCRGEIVDSASLNLEEIFALIEAAWRRGAKVARLHTGDPAIYGAIGEQIALCRAHGIPFAVIPGVSSALAVAARLGVELTAPERSQTVIFTRRGGRTPVPDRERLSSLAAHHASMMIFLSVAMIDDVVAELLAGGYEPDTPVAVIEKVSWPEEQQARGTLATIAAQVKAAAIDKTALIAVGDVLAEEPMSAKSRLYDAGFSHEFRQAISESAR
ncbi:MAG: precorrin-4 C(11)-methyltransferase [Desulfobulbaceae bacterium]|jgi:precorrin-4/cobalt-precorrin-4 C11-methyltransferase|nr:precorrin-4 C(11)-methyltransferase [Desulfobulbaceae bacterium]